MRTNADERQIQAGECLESIIAAAASRRQPTRVAGARTPRNKEWRIAESSFILSERGHFAFVESFATPSRASCNGCGNFAPADSRESFAHQRPLHCVRIDDGFSRACWPKSSSVIAPAIAGRVSP